MQSGGRKRLILDPGADKLALGGKQREPWTTEARTVVQLMTPRCRPVARQAERILLSLV